MMLIEIYSLFVPAIWFFNMRIGDQICHYTLIMVSGIMHWLIKKEITDNHHIGYAFIPNLYAYAFEKWSNLMTHDTIMYLYAFGSVRNSTICHVLLVMCV